MEANRPPAEVDVSCLPCSLAGLATKHDCTHRLDSHSAVMLQRIMQLGLRCSSAAITPHTRSAEQRPTLPRCVTMYGQLCAGPRRVGAGAALLSEPGRGGVSGVGVPVHAPAGLPGREDLHPDHVQRAEGALAGRHRAALRAPPRLRTPAQGVLVQVTWLRRPLAYCTCCCCCVWATRLSVSGLEFFSQRIEVFLAARHATPLGFTLASC